MIRDLLLQEYQIEKELYKRQARRSMAHFVAYTMPKYQFNWHHLVAIEKLEAFARGEIKRLMWFTPPRHGKSQLTSRHLPAWIFGQNPDESIIACSYAADLASDMNTDVQNIMMSEEYQELFPESSLVAKNYKGTTQPRRNSSQFDIVNHIGKYFSAGIGGPITGKGMGKGIIDDPYKNKEEAFSAAYREKVWHWYTSTFYTRLEKDAGILLTQTRWHEDDLGGRLLKAAREDPDADQWEVITFPAIKEANDNNPYDPREIGQALWPDKYDVVALNKIRSVVQSHWTPLYQQRPSAEAGNILKKDWFKRYDSSTVPKGVMRFYLDTAYTESKKNDRTAIISYWKSGNNIYIRDCRAVWKEFPDLLRFIISHVKEMGYTGSSVIKVEPKASGKSVVQQLRTETSLNIVEDKAPYDSKETRVRAKSSFIEAGRVLIPENGLWVDEFLNECATFPNAAHDDMVDCLIGAISDIFNSNQIEMSGHNWNDVR